MSEMFFQVTFVQETWDFFSWMIAFILIDEELTRVISLNSYLIPFF